MNHMDFDRHLIRQHNEEMLKEVRMQRLGASAKEQPGAFGTIAHPQLDLAECARVAARSGHLGIVHHHEERMRSEKVIFGVETRLPRLPPVRGEQTPPLGQGLDALRIVWWTLERGDARNPPAADRLARRFGKSPV